MVKIDQFEVTAWFDRIGHSAKHDLGMTATSLSINDLINISEHQEKSKEVLDLNNMVLSYNDPMRGGHALRQNLAALYSARVAGLTEDNILITNGGIDANNIVLSALVNPGDHVICHYPNYQQLYQIPQSLGAEVSLWKANPANKWKLDIEDLKSLIREDTKLIIVTCPHNPSGTIVPKSQLELIMELAEEKNITVMVDEAFRPLFHSITPSHDDFPPSALNLGYKKVVVTGTMSKAYGLPGIRIGWIASRNPEIITTCHKYRHYTTTTVSQLDEAVAAEALNDRCIHALLAKNIKNCQTNVENIQNFIDEHSWACSWVKPVAGSIAMIKFHKMGKPIDDEQFCLRLLEKASVCLVPASVCFGDRKEFHGYVRIGVVGNPEEVKDGLIALTTFMQDEYEDVPTMARK